MRIFALNPDECDTCGGPIVLGDEIEDTPTGWAHVACADGPDYELAGYNVVGMRKGSHMLNPPPLYESDDGNMCDDCPYCLDECGDEKRERP